MIGKPDISLTEKISPDDKLLSIANKDPDEPSNESELSDKTDNVIGLPVVPINAIVGLVAMPVEPICAELKDN